MHNNTKRKKNNNNRNTGKKLSIMSNARFKYS